MNHYFNFNESIPMNQARSVGNEEWWKIHEAVMLALGSTVVSMERHIDEGKVRVTRIMNY